MQTATAAPSSGRGFHKVPSVATVARVNTCGVEAIRGDVARTSALLETLRETVTMSCGRCDAYRLRPIFVPDAGQYYIVGSDVVLLVMFPSQFLFSMLGRSVLYGRRLPRCITRRLERA